MCILLLAEYAFKTKHFVCSGRKPELQHIFRIPMQCMVLLLNTCGFTKQAAGLLLLGNESLYNKACGGSYSMAKETFFGASNY